jgi:hypothetical protein
VSNQERPVTVTGTRNTIVARAVDHRWIALYRDGVELVRESGGEPGTTFTVPSGSYVVRTDGTLESVATEEGRAVTALARGHTATLSLSCDAAAAHPVIGVAELPADGTSTVTITVHGHEQDEAVHLRTTGGTLLAANTDDRIRSVRLRSGTATFRLMADSTPRLVTVVAFGDRTRRVDLPVEFV